MSNSWLALIIGNSRLHWAWIENAIDDEIDCTPAPFTIQQTWNTQHLTTQDTVKSERGDLETMLELLTTHQPPLVIASVVPSQTTTWEFYPKTKTLTLDDIPLPNLYPTLGIDRALAVLGAWHQWSRPILVIDGGTALTFTGANQKGEFIGGAILPGLGLQLRSLHQHTAALPKIRLENRQISRWASNTSEAVCSGIWHTLLAGIREFIQDWKAQYSDSVIIFTGGDGQRLHHALLAETTNKIETAKVAEFTKATPQKHLSLFYDPYVIFKGVAIAHLASYKKTLL